MKPKFSPKKHYITLFILISCCVIFYLFYEYKFCQNNKEAFNINITGIINLINYSSKKTPTIKIDNKKYYLGFFNVKDNDLMEVGDSIYKESKSRELFHFKKQDGSFVLYKKYRIHTDYNEKWLCRYLFH